MFDIIVRVEFLAASPPCTRGVGGDPAIAQKPEEDAAKRVDGCISFGVLCRLHLGRYVMFCTSVERAAA